jgi:TonB-linked SusC/RagA family outer membrane protein
MKNNWIKRRDSSNNSKIALKTMKIVIFLLCVMVFSVTANTYSQENQIDLHVENIAIKDVFKEIEKTSDYVFLLSGDLSNELNKRINADFTMISLDEAMGIIVQDTNIKYEIFDKQVIVYLNNTPSEIARPRTKKIQPPAPMVQIVGTVTDDNGIPLIGVNIIVLNTKTGAITDENGVFSIKVPIGATLRFTYIGFIAREIKITEQQTLNVRLIEELSQIDDVVITGYANVRKESFTGSVTQITKDEILKVSSGNLIQAIQAFDPSFRVMENIELGSNPNALPEFYIRGQSGLPGVKELDILESSDVSQFSLKTNPNIPIFILDGFEASIEKIYDLDIARIKSVTLLKDASSTAIYGSRASNGVIVIETTPPQSGKLRINYSGNYALTTPDLSSYNLMNTKEKIQAEIDANLFGNPEPWELQFENFETVRQNKHLNYLQKHNQYLRGVDTYWLSRPVTTMFNHKHTLFIEGGIDVLRYGAEIRYDRNNGVMRGSLRENKGIGLMMEYINNKFQLRNQISFNIMSNKNSPYGNFNSYARLQPYYEFLDEETGELIKEYSNIWGARSYHINPLYNASLKSFDKAGYLEWINNLSLNWYLTQHLLLKGQYAVTYKDSHTNAYTDPASTMYSNSNYLQKGELRNNNMKDLKHNVNFFVAYNQALKEHYVNFSLGINAIINNYDSESYWYRGFLDKSFHTPAYAFEIVEKPFFSDNKTRLFGTFFTSNYSYKNIYLIESSIRVDGSSEFGTRRKWAPFWSLGTGLNIHYYPFLKENKTVTMFRLIGNIGETGKSNFLPYMANSIFEILKDDWYLTGMGANLIYLGNENLKWEKTISSNIATDITFVNRYSFRFDLYHKTTNALISDVSLPSSSGFTVYKDNVGEIVNRGFEAIINLNIVKTKNTAVNIFGNMAHNRGKISKISESLKQYNERIDKYYEGYVGYDAEMKDPIYKHKSNSKYSKPLKKFKEGNSVTSIYGMKSLGINPANGKEVYERSDGSITYDWNSTELQVIGDTEPWAQGTFGVNAQHKRWTLYTTFLYEFGGERYNQTLVDIVENVDLASSNADKRIGMERWKKLGDVAPLKDIKDGLIITRPTSRFVQKNNFVKFNSISLGYDFDPVSLKRFNISMLRLQFTMNDIALFSSIRREMGTSYPFARTFTLTLNTTY